MRKILVQVVFNTGVYVFVYIRVEPDIQQPDIEFCWISGIQLFENRSSFIQTTPDIRWIKAEYPATRAPDSQIQLFEI